MRLKILIVKGLLLLVLLYFSIPEIGYSQTDPQDSLILVEFYNATNGDNWLNNDNWLVTPVHWWYGVTLWNDTFVQKIILPGNGLNGTLSPLLCQLPWLWAIDFSNNNISGQIPDCWGSSGHFSAMLLDNNHLSGTLPESLGYIADFTTLDFLIKNNDFEGVFPDTIIKAEMIKSLEITGNKFTSISRATSWLFYDLYMEKNCFTFEDVMPYKLDPPLGILTYAPQDSVLTEIDTTLLIGNTLVMDAWVDTCSNNKYRWKKNGNFLNIAPSTDPLWVIPNVQYSDSGYYTCDITNNLAGQLVLKRRLIKVHVTTDVGDLKPKVREELRVSRDPKEDMLHILMDFNTAETVSCNLFDVNGRKVMRCYEGTTQKQDFHYSLHSFPHGVYFLRTTAGDKSYTHKILK
jgi:hypothetical protein